jgi:hypothetical protein
MGGHCRELFVWFVRFVVNSCGAAAARLSGEMGLAWDKSEAWT